MTVLLHSTVNGLSSKPVVNPSPGVGADNSDQSYASSNTDHLQMNVPFAKRIALMNAMYRLPSNATPVLPADVAERLQKFKATLSDEVDEIDDIVAMARDGASSVDVAVAIADLLGDIIVYCRSEALKYGIPLDRKSVV
jgi:hypothetical protein